MIYKWIVEFCDSVDYILFVDDDYLVNVDNILDAIRRQKCFTGVDVMYGYKLFWRSPIDKDVLLPVAVAGNNFDILP
jgi:hypothetical protein